MSKKSPPRFNWRSHPRSSPMRHEPPVAAAGEPFIECCDHFFHGSAIDPAAGMYNFAPRAFDPSMKPWVQCDPLAYVDGLNLYTALHDNPINATNPLGETAD